MTCNRGQRAERFAGKNIHLQTHHKRTARLLLSLCALDVYLQYVCRVDGSRLLGDVPKIGQMCLIAWMAASPPVEVSLKNRRHPADRRQELNFECFTPARVCLILGSPLHSSLSYCVEFPKWRKCPRRKCKPPPSIFSSSTPVSDLEKRR